MPVNSLGVFAGGEKGELGRCFLGGSVRATRNNGRQLCKLAHQAASGSGAALATLPPFEHALLGPVQCELKCGDGLQIQGTRLAPIGSRSAWSCRAVHNKDVDTRIVDEQYEWRDRDANLVGE
jgi:hypothetical protein